MAKKKTKPARKAAPPPVAADKPAGSKWTVTTQTAVGEFFGVSFDTVKSWARNGMPRSDKRYNLAEIARWLLERRGRQTMATPEAADRRSLLELRKLNAEVEKVERANAASMGLLVDRRAVESQIAQALIELRKRFERLPARIQPLLPRELEATLLPEFKRLINQTLHEVATEMQDHCATAEAEPEASD